jgi:drug/metabolite transporter (DMT)-like permease
LIALLAGLLAALSWGLGCLLFDRAQSRPPASVGRPPSAAGMNLFKNSIACALFLVTCLALGWSLPRGEAALMLLLSGVVGFAIGDSLYFAAFPKAGVQLTAMMGNLTPPLAGLFGWWFLGASFAVSTMLWMGVVILGISLVVLDPVGAPKRTGQEAPRRALGVLFAFGAALSQAVGIVLAHSAFQEVGVLAGTVVRLFGGIGMALPLALAAGLFAGKRGRLAAAREGLAEVLRPLSSRALFGMLIVPTLAATVVSLPLHSFCVRGAPSHLAALVLATSPLFILPLGRLFGARHGLLSIAGTLVGFGGLAGVLFS